MDGKLKIEYIDINSVKKYNKNAKLHPEEQIEQIKKSILQFSNCDPIGIWHDIIVEGHGRYEALKQLGYKEIPVIRLDHLTNEQRKAYSLAHNKLTMNSDFDIELLDLELADIDIDMTMFGFGEEIKVDDFGDDFTLPDGDKNEICQMTFTLHKEQKALIEYAIGIIADNVSETFGNTNKNGNGLYEVVKQWVEQKK